ncbi:pyridoxamine 5'-phosphate oxidase family protein [Spiractinospora alimapuensis]|nr:pyridoxamine 5'-phosphate oxidase family protein [Spiractinospora alimapuensis]
MQSLHGTRDRADRFYRDQMLDHLNPRMRAFIGRQEMMFIATADRRGACDSSFRAGPPGFVHVLDAYTLAYPEYRGNGVLASVGNIAENPQVGLLFLDFDQERIGLHVNGSAMTTGDAELRRRTPSLPVPQVPGQRALLWMVVRVEEAYIHCRKHVPHLRKVDRDEAWGTDDTLRKGGDYFEARGTNTDSVLASTPTARHA